MPPSPPLRQKLPSWYDAQPTRRQHKPLAPNDFRNTAGSRLGPGVARGVRGDAACTRGHDDVVVTPAAPSSRQTGHPGTHAANRRRFDDKAPGLADTRTRVGNGARCRSRRGRRGSSRGRRAGHGPVGHPGGRGASPRRRHRGRVDAEDIQGFHRDMVPCAGSTTRPPRCSVRGARSWAPCLGQEAAQVGSGRALRPQDFAFPTYREHGVAWCRGVDPLNLLGMFRGAQRRGGTVREELPPYTIIIGAQTPHATGCAMGSSAISRRHRRAGPRHGGHRLLRRRRASAQGDVGEAFVLAGVNNAPVVFFCQNNQWAISEPNERQMRVPIYQRAKGYSFPAPASTATTSSRRMP